MREGDLFPRRPHGQAIRRGCAGSGAGHTSAPTARITRSPFTMPLAKAEQEIEEGIAWTGAALGDRKLVAPFFRSRAAARRLRRGASRRPGLIDLERGFPGRRLAPHLGQRGSAARARAARGQGQGRVLLHDIQPRTVAPCPVLRELKRRGYKIVHVVAAAPTAEDPTEPSAMAIQSDRPRWLRPRAGRGSEFRLQDGRCPAQRLDLTESRLERYGPCGTCAAPRLAGCPVVAAGR